MSVRVLHEPQGGSMQTEIEEKDGSWILRIPGPNGRPQELHCATEQMARQLASSLARRTPVPQQRPRQQQSARKKQLHRFFEDGRSREGTRALSRRPVFGRG